MSLTKEQTDAIIIAQNTPTNPINELHFRSVESQHPIDCKCDNCRLLKFNEAGTEKSLETRDDLNWYMGE